MGNATFEASERGSIEGKAMGRPWTVVAAIAGALAAFIAAWSLLPLGDWIADFRDWVAAHGLAGHIAFVAVYAVATVALAPVSLLTLAAGVAFGLWAVPTVLAGAGIGLALAFLIGRYLARDWVARRVAGSRMFRAVDRAIENEGWKVVGLLRLSPLVPFNLQNYFFGVTRIGFVEYLVASLVGIIPGTFLYVWIGSLGGAASSEASTWKIVALGAGLLATVLVTVLISRTAQAKLHEFGVDDDATP